MFCFYFWCCHNFNFIMILFYCMLTLWNERPYIGFQFHYDLILLRTILHTTPCCTIKFQFHYDLILFLCFVVFFLRVYIFQFHYDLILFPVSSCSTQAHSVISISLWSYSIGFKTPEYPLDFLRFQFHYDLILLGYHGSSVCLSCSFQFHYDLILFSNNTCIINNIITISISLWSYSIEK